MADITDAKANINDVEVSADQPVSEALFEKIGGAINYLNTTTDDHETRITAFETAKVEKTASVTGSTTSTSYVSLTSDSITPDNTNVFLAVEGIFSQDTGNAGGVRIKRGASVLRTLSVGVNGTRDFVYLDTAATADSSNTYSVEVLAQSGSTLSYNFKMSLMNIK